jgi:hypothetical protein
MKKNRKSLPQNEAKIRHFAGLSFHTPGSRYEREKEPYISERIQVYSSSIMHISKHFKIDSGEQCTTCL